MYDYRAPRPVTHEGTVTRKGTPRQAPGLACRLRLSRLYLWLIAGRKAVCACGWHAIAASNSAADHELAAHTMNGDRP